MYRAGGFLGPDVQLRGFARVTQVEFDIVAKTGSRVVLDLSSGATVGMWDRLP